MKKVLTLATVVLLSACYTPMNNSGVSTNKPWLDVSGTRLDFKGEQYDSCFQFRLHFWPPEVQDHINLKEACISACCWRSEKNEVVLDFNHNFEKELLQKGRARRYTPEKITLKVTHSNFANYTKVAVEPRGAITNNGLLKLSYEEVENPTRLAQLQKKAQAATAEGSPSSALLRAQTAFIPPALTETAPTTAAHAPGHQTTARKTKQKKSVRPRAVSPAKQTTPLSPETTEARALLQAQMGTKIDDYFYQMNKTYSQQGAIFILSSRLLPVTAYGNGLYLITCHAKARTGLDEKNLNASDFPCGKWLINTTLQTVTPHDDKAKRIAR